MKESSDPERELVTNVVVSALDVLRADPALAARLVGPSGGVTRYEFTHDPEHGPWHDHERPDSTYMRAVTVHTGPWNRIHSGQ